MKSTMNQIAIALACLLVSVRADELYVTCGSAIKLESADTGYYLNSEEKQLGSGSGQQIITFVKDKATRDTLWWVRPAHTGDEQEYPNEATCQLAEPVRCGQTIRLTHVDTMRNLHSHNVKSPLSSQQEVTAFGTGDAKGDAGDDWIVECSGKYWMRDNVVRLIHDDTKRYLGTSHTTEFNQQTCGHNCPIMGHLEAFARRSADKYSEMKVHQGIHLSN